MALGKNPGEGQLCGGRAFLAGELFYRVCQSKVGFERFLPETRIRPAPITGIQILEFLDHAC